MGKNQTSFKKGQSGNPKGRPEYPFKVALRKALSEVITTKEGKKVMIQDALSKALIGEGLKGDVQAINSIMNRMDGMPQQATDLTTKGEKIESNAIIFTDFTNDPNAAESK